MNGCKTKALELSGHDGEVASDTWCIQSQFQELGQVVFVELSSRCAWFLVTCTVVLAVAKQKRDYRFAFSSLQPLSA